MVQIGTPETIGESNKRAILHHLRQRGSMSRADLSRLTGLSFPAVSSNVKHLLEMEYISEVGTGGNAVGRKSILLSYNSKRGMVVGVDIGRSKIQCMAADLLGEAIADETSFCDAAEDGDAIINKVVESVTRVVAKAVSVPSRVLSICVGIPGLIRGGNIYLAPFIAEFSVTKLVERLESAFSASVVVENGVNLGALGELWQGYGSKFKNLVYISYGIGLGSAIVINGELYTGSDGAAGEIGFMLISPDAGQPYFQQSGCLENAVSPHLLAPYLSSKSLARDIDSLFCSDDKQSGGKEALQSISQHMGAALVNVGALFNPEAIIISGGMGKAVGAVFIETWKKILAANLPYPPTLLLSELDDCETMLGAVGTAVRHVEESLSF